MRTYLECIPCFIRQGLDAARLVTGDAAVHEHVLRKTLELAAEMPFDRSPPWMGQQIHRLLRQATGNGDPYEAAKRQANDFALALQPALRKQVHQADDPLAAAVHLAIAGNVIDLGCKREVTEEEVRRAIDDALSEALEAEAVEEFRAAVGSAPTILYLADNAGEIILDRLLIEQLPMERVTVAVRGKPVINDATRADARAAGLTSLVEVVDNGSDVPGTILEECSSEFRQRFVEAELVIAKGQGNYETLSDSDANIYFLFKAKCPVIAAHIGCQVGQAVLCRSRPHQADSERVPPESPSKRVGGG